MRQAELREQFLAVLGHDLGNPIGAIGAGVQLMKRHATATTSAEILTQMQSSVLRMSELIDNLMDFARVRLGAASAYREWRRATSLRRAGQTVSPPLPRRGSPQPAGLGLGLCIASEIARAHDGSLTAASTGGNTSFTLRVPA
ncbi:MAG: sensor histidine kinase [Hyphomonadaceae bacterium]